MGITRVGTKEAEGFERDLDSPEYHDTIEEPLKRGEHDTNEEQPKRGKESERDVEPLPKLGVNQGGYGSSSLKECIELLNATANTPAPLDSGVGIPRTPSQVMSPNMDNSLAKADAATSSGSTSQAPSQVKKEPQVKTESVPSDED